MASACALRQLASAKLTYFQIMRLDPLVKNGRDVGQAEDAAQCGPRSQGEKARQALIEFHARSCSRGSCARRAAYARCFQQMNSAFGRHH
jgi:hypothetical protein